MIQPIRDGILFEFVDGIESKTSMFTDQTDWGFTIAGDSATSGKYARWGRVVAIGPDVPTDDIDVGTMVCIEPLMWSTGVEFEGSTVWKTDVTKILGTSPA